MRWNHDRPTSVLGRRRQITLYTLTLRFFGPEGISGSCHGLRDKKKMHERKNRECETGKACGMLRDKQAGSRLGRAGRRRPSKRTNGPRRLACPMQDGRLECCGSSWQRDGTLGRADSSDGQRRQVADPAGWAASEGARRACLRLPATRILGTI